MRGVGALRLAVVLLAGVAVAAVGTSAEVPRVDLRRVGLSGGPGTAVTTAGRTAAVDRSELVCPGPETIGVKGTDAVGTPPGPAQVVTATAPVGLLDLPPVPAAGSAARVVERVLPGGAPSGDPVPSQDLASSDDAPAGSASVTGRSVLAAGVSVVGTGARAPGLVADQLTAVLSGDLRGLSSTSCTPASDDTWLVGGGTGEGRRGRIVLVNPGANPIDVQVEVLGAGGPVRRSAGSSVAVPSRGRVVLLLDALAPGVVSPVVHVSASGGAVAATLHDSSLAGTAARGVDDVGPAAAPARRVLVPGIVIDGPASLRVASTTSAEAVAQVRLFGPAGPVDLPDAGVVRVAGGSASDIPLAVPAGAYTAEVTSDVPVVAAAAITRSGPVLSELAWLRSSGPVVGVAGTAIAPVGDVYRSVVVLGATRTAASVDVVMVLADGTSTSVPVLVPAGRTVGVVQVGGGAVWVRPREGSGEVVAARVVTRADANGTLVTGGPLRVPARTEQLPALTPAR